MTTAGMIHVLDQVEKQRNNEFTLGLHRDNVSMTVGTSSTPAAWS